MREGSREIRKRKKVNIKCVYEWVVVERCGYNFIGEFLRGCMKYI